MNTAHHIVNGMLAAEKPSWYWTTDGVSYEFEELLLSKSLIQRNNQSVWSHTMSVLDCLEIKNDTTLLAALLHDLGKTKCDNVSPRSRFDGHAAWSHEIAKRQLVEWGTAPAIMSRVLKLVSTHMLDISNMRRRRTIRKFVAHVGLDNIDNWFALRTADSASYRKYNKYRKNLIAPFLVTVMDYLSSLPQSGGPNFSNPSMQENIRIRGVN